MSEELQVELRMPIGLEIPLSLLDFITEAERELLKSANIRVKGEEDD